MNEKNLNFVYWTSRCSATHNYKSHDSISSSPEFIHQACLCLCAVKEVEHSKELSNNLYQRQLAAERRKTVSVLEENQTLQHMLEELTQKLRVRINKDKHQQRLNLACSVWVSSMFGLLILFLLEEGERTRCHEHLLQPCREILCEKRHRE